MEKEDDHTIIIVPSENCFLGQPKIETNYEIGMVMVMEFENFEIG
jgi:hypothetical protein